MKYKDIKLIDILTGEPIETRYWTTAKTDNTDGNDEWSITMGGDEGVYKGYLVKRVEIENGELKLY